MPQRKCALKMLRGDKKRRLRNSKVKNDLKKSLKKFQSLLAAKNSQEAKQMLPEIVSKLDKAARKGIISQNTASRRKSRLSIRLKKISG